jgi:hypothetical protein
MRGSSTHAAYFDGAMRTLVDADTGTVELIWWYPFETFYIWTVPGLGQHGRN